MEDQGANSHNSAPPTHQVSLTSESDVTWTTQYNTGGANILSTGANAYSVPQQCLDAVFKHIGPHASSTTMLNYSEIDQENMDPVLSDSADISRRECQDAWYTNVCNLTENPQTLSVEEANLRTQPKVEKLVYTAVRDEKPKLMYMSNMDFTNDSNDKWNLSTPSKLMKLEDLSDDSDGGDSTSETSFCDQEEQEHDVSCMNAQSFSDLLLDASEKPFSYDIIQMCHKSKPASALSVSELTENKVPETQKRRPNILAPKRGTQVTDCAGDIAGSRVKVSENASIVDLNKLEWTASGSEGKCQMVRIPICHVNSIKASHREIQGDVSPPPMTQPNVGNESHPDMDSVCVLNRSGANGSAADPEGTTANDVVIVQERRVTRSHGNPELGSPGSVHMMTRAASRTLCEMSANVANRGLNCSENQEQSCNIDTEEEEEEALKDEREDDDEEEGAKHRANVTVLNTWKIPVARPSAAETPTPLLTGTIYQPKPATISTAVGMIPAPTGNISQECGQRLMTSHPTAMVPSSSNLLYTQVGGPYKTPKASYSNVTLNSSGSEDTSSPPDFAPHLDRYNPGSLPAPAGYNPGLTPALLHHGSLLPSANQLNAALFRAKENLLTESDFDLGRQAHNAKERARRARIKLACEHLRDIVPGMTIKTDKATVFEFAVQYIAFLKRIAGGQYDKEFLRQCSPY